MRAKGNEFFFTACTFSWLLNIINKFINEIAGFGSKKYFHERKK